MNAKYFFRYAIIGAAVLLTVGCLIWFAIALFNSPQTPAAGNILFATAIPLGFSFKMPKWVWAVIVVAIIVAAAIAISPALMPQHINASLPQVSTSNDVLVMTSTATADGCHYQMNIGDTMWRQFDDTNPCSTSRRLAWFQEIKAKLEKLLNRYGDGTSVVQEMNISLMVNP